MYSYWEQNLLFENIDTAILGGGIVGISAAIHLKNKFPNRKIVVIDRDAFPSGASTKNAGFCCFGSVGEILDDLKTMDEHEVTQLIQMRYQGLQLLKATINLDAMQYQEKGGVEVFDKENDDDATRCIDKIKWVNELVATAIGKKGTFSVKSQNFGFDLHPKMIFNQYEGSIHPGKMMFELYKIAIQKGIVFLGNMEIESFFDMEDQVILKRKDGFDIYTNQLVVCTNAFSRKLLPDLDVVPARNQVLVTSRIKGLNFDTCFHYDKGYVYFRNYQDRLLIGGARNIDPETETTTGYGENQKIIAFLKQFAKEKILIEKSHYVDYKWSGIIAVGDSKKPIIKSINPRLFVAVRSGGMGVAIGSLIGKNIADLVE